MEQNMKSVAVRCTLDVALCLACGLTPPQLLTTGISYGLTSRKTCVYFIIRVIQEYTMKVSKKTASLVENESFHFRYSLTSSICLVFNLPMTLCDLGLEIKDYSCTP